MAAAPPDPSEIIRRLEYEELRIDQIFLDPNNPRLVEVRGSEEPEDSIDDPEVQEDTFRQLKEDGIEDLRGSIATVGFLPISMLVVRRHFKRGSKNYVVIEGNRRIAAIKWILREAPPGLDEKLLNRRRRQISKLEVLRLDTDQNRLGRDRLLLQGIVHVSPVRIWPAYARAQACYNLEQRGLETPGEIARALGGGIKPNEVGRLLRAYYAYMQMAEDEEFGSEASEHREYLSWISEVIARPKLRNDWLGWGDKQRIFTNDENLRKLYRLFVDGKIRRQTDVRSLPKILDFAPDMLERLLTEDDYFIDLAYSEAVGREQAQRAPPPIPWRDRVREAIEVLERSVSLPFQEGDVKLMDALAQLARKRLGDIKRFLRVGRKR